LATVKYGLGLERRNKILVSLNAHVLRKINYQAGVFVRVCKGSLHLYSRSGQFGLRLNDAHELARQLTGFHYSAQPKQNSSTRGLSICIEI